MPTGYMFAGHLLTYSLSSHRFLLNSHANDSHFVTRHDSDMVSAYTWATAGEVCLLDREVVTPEQGVWSDMSFYDLNICSTMFRLAS